eukprot:scaffold2003_cov420-Prasinococcus_capsulatus_cf.AAC.2
MQVAPAVCGETRAEVWACREIVSLVGVGDRNSLGWAWRGQGPTDGLAAARGSLMSVSELLAVVFLPTEGGPSPLASCKPAVPQRPRGRAHVAVVGQKRPSRPPPCSALPSRCLVQCIVATVQHRVEGE